MSDCQIEENIQPKNQSELKQQDFEVDSVTSKKSLDAKENQNDQIIELKSELQKLNWKYTTLKSVVSQKDLVNDQLIAELQQIKSDEK